ncbi:MAG: GNAT family N-acetyltransferase [Cyanobacteria bacterium RI_101]|nr:GNAT family N-acetyltransferase [Cyanobacteria bacterium RI_101]
MLLRPYRPEDGPALTRLFQETVRAVNSRDYTPAQIQAWAPDSLDPNLWERRCRDAIARVAEAQGQVLGFIILRRDGYLDCLYCHKDYRRRQVGLRLYQEAAEEARNLGLTRLWTDASITALPFFERLGFTLARAQTVRLRGETFLNYRLEKDLRQGFPNG